MAIMINPNAIQKGSITKEMLTQGARRPIILTQETTEVDEETYQKLLSDDVDVMFKTDDGNLCKLTFANFGISDTVNFTCLSIEGNTMADFYIYGYSVAIDKNSPHICHITEDINTDLQSFINSSGYLSKYELSPVLQEIDLTSTDAQRKAKLDKFEADWKALTGASDLSGARFVGKVQDENTPPTKCVFTFDPNNNAYWGLSAGSEDDDVVRKIYVDCIDGTIYITPLFSHLEPVEIFTDNSVASKQKNIDNLNAYKSNLTELGVDTNKSFQVPFREGDNATFIGTLQYSVDTNTYIGVGCSSDEDTARIIRISSTGESTITNLALADNLSRVIRDLGMYPELEPVPLNSEVTGKYINSDGKYVDASDWNIASIGAVSLGNTYLLNMVSSANMVLGVALFVSRVYKRDKEGKIIGTTLTPLFSAKNTSIPASGYVLFEAMDDYDDVLVCYKPALTTQMLVARWGFKASHATQLRNLRMIVDNKTDFEGIYELLTAGYALNLVGKGNGEPQAFMSRKTGGGNITDGSAVIKEVDGVQPIVWNQIHNNGHYRSNFATKILLEPTIGSLKISMIENVSSSTAIYNMDAHLIAHHKYALVGEWSATSTCVCGFCGSGFNESTEVSQVPSSFGVVFTFVDKWFDAYYYMIINASAETSIDFANGRLIDLTQMFGAGNEPSTYEEYLDRISHYHIADEYAYNAGEVVNYKGTGIKTTGRNLWDEEWESGRLENGENYASPSHFRSKNFISVDPTKQYFIRATGCFISEYDVNKTFIEQRDSFTDVAISLPANCRYIRFWCFNQPTYNYDICINLSDPAFNGQYEPYKSYVRDWSEVMKKYFPDGMTSLNGVKDFFNEKKAVRKFGVVDLGSLSYYKGGNVWISIIPDYKTNTPNVYVNAFTTKYTQTIANNEMSSVDCPNLKFYANAGGQVGGIGIRDDAYTTAESFKAAMAGVLLFYELAEPVEDIFEKPLNLTYTVINGGTETSLATENSTQFEGSIAYNKDYVAVVDELQMQNRVTQIEFENWEN